MVQWSRGDQMLYYEELLKCFDNAMYSGRGKYAKLPIIRYLLGNNLGNALYADSTLRDRLKLRNWTTEELRLFAEIPSSHWFLSSSKKETSSFAINNYIEHDTYDLLTLIEELQKLMVQYSLSTTDSFDVRFKKLISLIFWNTPDVSQLFEPYDLGTLTHYVACNDLEDNLKTAINTTNLIFVCGGPASGKRLLTRKVLKEHFSTSSDIYFSDALAEPLKDHFEKISFINGTHELQTVLSYLKGKSSKSVLIIRKPFLDAEDFTFINAHLSSLTLKIIFLTQTYSLDQKYLYIDMKKRPGTDLQNIYINARGLNDLKPSEWKLIQNVTTSNPYAVSLVGKALREADTLEDQKNFKEAFLNKTEWIWNLSKKPTAHGNYHVDKRKSEQTLPMLLSYMLECYGNYRIYSEISIWAKTPISFSFLTDFVGINPQTIQQALQYGLLEYDCETIPTVFMPSIIADVIWNQESSSYPYSKYCDKLQQFLELIVIGNPNAIPYQALYPMVRTLMQRFHFQVTKLESSENANTNADFVEWNRTLIKIILELTELGEWKIAEEFLPYIFYSKQSKKYNDIAEDGDRLIRKIIAFKINFMKNGYSDIVPATLKEILTETYSLLQQSDKRVSHCWTEFAIMAIQSFLDYELRTEKIILVDYINTHDEKLLKYSQQLDVHLDNFIQLFKYVLPTGYYSYYTLIKSYRNKLFTNSLENKLDIITEHQNNLLNLITTYPEFFLKAECQNIFFELLHVSKDENYAHYFYQNNLFALVEITYNHLTHMVIGNIYSADTLCLLYFCTGLLIPYHKILTEETRQFLKHAYDSMKYFANEQLTLTKKDKTTLIKFIKENETLMS